MACCAIVGDDQALHNTRVNRKDNHSMVAAEAFAVHGATRMGWNIMTVVLIWSYTILAAVQLTIEGSWSIFVSLTAVCLVALT